MAKFILGAVAFCLTLVLGSCAGWLKTAGELRNEATVSVAVTCGEGGGSGSGVIIGEQYILTAGHVATFCPEGSLEVITSKGERFPAKVDRVLEGSDIARLKINGKFKAQPMRDVGMRPHIGDEVCLHSGSPHRDIRCGVVSELTEGAGDVKHSAVTEPGNSGGPVFNKAGELVGLVTHYYPCQNGQFCGGRFSSLWDRKFILTQVN